MNLKSLFVRKPMRSHSNEVEDEEQHGLRKHLGAFQLTTIGIGAIIGAGIFVITGQASAEYAGPAISLSFIIAAVVCLLAGLCYAELSALIPVSGGSYSYSYVALGEFPAWIVGWAITSQAIFSASTVAVGWSGYCVSILKDFGIALPFHLANSPILYSADRGWHLSGAYLNVPAVILVALVGVLITVGIKAAARFNNIMVVIKLTTIALFIILGLAYINTENWTPFIPENTGLFGQFGWTGILRAAGLLFFAYIGFDTVSTLAHDSVNPQRDLPRGILGSLIICSVAYIITALVLTGVVSFKFLNVPDPMSVALNAMGSSFLWLKMIVKFAILAGLASVTLVQLLGQTRVFFAMSKDGLLPQRFSAINKSTRTPVFCSIITAIVCLVIAGCFPVNVLGEVVSLSTLFLFGIVCLGVLILRKTHPEFKRPFKVPFVPYVPLAGILCCWTQMGFLPMAAWIQFLFWLGLGLVIYFAYGRFNSKIRKAHS